MAEVIEETQNTDAINPEVTAEGNQGYSEALLKGDGSTPNQDVPIDNQQDANNPNAQKAEASQDPEFDLGEGVKAKLSEIKEWKSGNMRQADYVKKLQEFVPHKKSLEEVYGQKLPEPQQFRNEMRNFAQIRKAYLERPEVQKVVDAIIEGGDLSKALSGQPSNQSSGNQSPEVQQLNQKIAALEQQLQGFTESQVKQQAAGVWSGWVDKQAKAGIQITQDIDSAMAPFVTALSQAHPDWDDNKILDTAYRHATIGEVEKKIVSQTLQQADKAKTQTPPKINPKVATKPDSQKSYSEIIADSL